MSLGHDSLRSVFSVHKYAENRKETTRRAKKLGIYNLKKLTSLTNKSCHLKIAACSNLLTAKVREEVLADIDGLAFDKSGLNWTKVNLLMKKMSSIKGLSSGIRRLPRSVRC